MPIEWLMANASPVIRYRTQTELIRTADKESLQNAMTKILDLPQTQKRLTLLRNLDYNRTHGGPGTYLENVLPMLNDFGLYYDTDAFNSETKSISDIANIVLNENYDKITAYPFLLRSKFPIGGLLEFAVERINTIYDFTRRMDFDIYDDIKNYKGVPKSFQDRPLIKPSVACIGNFRIPLIYDIVAFAEIYKIVSSDIQGKIDNIIGYILSPEYDVVIPMYGIVSAGPRKYYAMGWDCKKPFNDNQGFSYPNLHRLLLYSHFPAAVKSMWFQNAVDYLTQYKTQNGTYAFPKEYLPEADGCWVLGVRMSLAENRRKNQHIEIESTFYMLKLLSCMR